MSSDFTATYGIVNDVHYWMYYSDEVLQMLYQRYIMSKRITILPIRDYKLGVL